MFLRWSRTAAAQASPAAANRWNTWFRIDRCSCWKHVPVVEKVKDAPCTGRIHSASDAGNHYIEWIAMECEGRLPSNIWNRATNRKQISILLNMARFMHTATSMVSGKLNSNPSWKRAPQRGPFFGLNNKKKQNLIFSQHLVSFLFILLKYFGMGT